MIGFLTFFYTQLEKQTKTKKTIIFFHRGLFKDKWEPRYFRFYDDGILEMFEDEGCFNFLI